MGGAEQTTPERLVTVLRQQLPDAQDVELRERVVHVRIERAYRVSS